MYKNEFERSKKDVYAHFGQEGRDFKIFSPFLAFIGDFVCCLLSTKFNTQPSTTPYLGERKAN